MVTCFIFVGLILQVGSLWHGPKPLLQVGFVDRESSWNWTQWWGLIFIHIVIFSWFGNQVLQPWYSMIRLETVHCSGGSSRCCSIRQYRPVQPSVDTAGICRLVGLMFLRKIYPPPWTDLSRRDKQFYIVTPPPTRGNMIYCRYMFQLVASFPLVIHWFGGFSINNHRTLMSRCHRAPPQGAERLRWPTSQAMAFEPWRGVSRQIWRGPKQWQF